MKYVIVVNLLWDCCCVVIRRQIGQFGVIIVFLSAPFCGHTSFGDVGNVHPHRIGDEICSL